MLPRQACHAAAVAAAAAGPGRSLLPGASAGKAQQFVQACQYIKKGQAAFPRRRAVRAGHPRASASWVQRLTIQAEGWSAAVQLTCSAGVQMHADIGFLEDNHKRVQAYCAAG